MTNKDEYAQPEAQPAPEHEEQVAPSDDQMLTDEGAPLMGMDDDEFHLGDRTQLHHFPPDNGVDDLPEHEDSQPDDFDDPTPLFETDEDFYKHRFGNKVEDGELDEQDLTDARRAESIYSGEGDPLAEEKREPIVIPVFTGKRHDEADDDLHGDPDRFEMPQPEPEDVFANNHSHTVYVVDHDFEYDYNNKDDSLSPEQRRLQWRWIITALFSLIVSMAGWKLVGHAGNAPWLLKALISVANPITLGVLHYRGVGSTWESNWMFNQNPGLRKRAEKNNTRIDYYLLGAFSIYSLVWMFLV